MHIMDDKTFLQAFEDSTLAPHLFPHRAHIRMAWLYLREFGWDAGVIKISEGIQRFAAAQGATRKYHTTITLFWAHIVQHMITDAPEVNQFEDFLNRYPQILEPSLISRHYSDALLRSELARHEWVDPDLVLPVD